MKKILLVLLVTLALSGCGNNKLEITNTFDYAEIMMPDGRIVEGEVEAWSDCIYRDEIQVVIDGVTYMTHFSNVVLYTRR